MARAKEAIIVDASVVVKWFVDEQNTKQALRLREDYRAEVVDLWSTQLMPFEVLNALRYSEEFGEKELVTVSLAISKYMMALHPILGEMAELCVRNAFRYGITIYDSSYVSLAKLTERKLYTADERLLGKVGESRLVRHISEYTA